jgi:hypothetical protein
MVSSGCLASPSLGRVWSQSKQPIATGVLWMRKCRDNPIAFHKACQVGVAFFGLCYGRNLEPTEKFGKLFAILQAADMQYFFGFLSLPTLFFYPVRSETIDAAQLRDAILARCHLAGSPAEREFLDNIIKFKLNQMAGGTHSLNGSYSAGYGHTSIREFEDDLLRQIRSLSPEMIHDDDHPVTNRYIIRFPESSKMPPVLLEQVRTPEAVAEIENLKAQLLALQERRDVSDSAAAQPLVVSRRISLAERLFAVLEKIGTVLGGLGDIGTVFWFLNQWNLIDTAKIGMSLGQIKGFSWMQKQSLGAWVWGTYSIVFAIHFTLSLRRYVTAAEGSEERTFAKRDAVVALAEVALSVAWFLESASLRAVPKRALFGLAFVAKGLGLCNIIYKMKNQNIGG